MATVAHVLPRRRAATLLAADAATDRLVVTVRSPAGDPVPDREVRSTTSTNPGFTGTTGANGWRCSPMSRPVPPAPARCRGRTSCRGARDRRAGAGIDGAFESVTADGSGHDVFRNLRPRQLPLTGASAAAPEAANGTSAGHTITLATNGGTLVGRVVRADGGARPGRYVGVTANVGSPGDVALPGMVSPNGTHRIDGVPAAFTQVRAVSNAGGTAYSAQTRVDSGETTTVPKIVLSPAS